MNMHTGPSYAKEGEKTQRAAVYNDYNEPVVVVSNLALDENIGENYVLVKVASVSVNPVDWKVRKGYLKTFLPLKFPIITGRDFSGQVVKIGSKVSKFRVGDEVYGLPEPFTGTHLEYVSCHQDCMTKKPAKLSWNEAASIPLCAATAYDGIVEFGKFQAGQSIFILGGSTGCGIYGIQIAKNLGASKIVVTCGTQNVDMVKELGADVVVDYKKEDFTKVLAGQKFDLIFDAVGDREDRDKSFDFVASKGHVTTTNAVDDRLNVANTATMLADAAWKNITNYLSNGVTYKPFMVGTMKSYVFEQCNRWFEEGKLQNKIDSVLTLEQTQEGHEKSAGGKLSGKIVIEVAKI